MRKGKISVHGLNQVEQEVDMPGRDGTGGETRQTGLNGKVILLQAPLQAAKPVCSGVGRSIFPLEISMISVRNWRPFVGRGVYSRRKGRTGAKPAAMKLNRKKNLR